MVTINLIEDDDSIMTVNGQYFSFNDGYTCLYGPIQDLGHIDNFQLKENHNNNS